MDDKKVSKTPEKVSGQKPLSIKRSDEKPIYWKPEKVGEKVEGKLIGIMEGGFGDVLKIKTKKGVLGVNVNQFLKDIDFTEYANQNLRFAFKGKVGKRGLMVFDVDLIPEKDEVPF